MNEGAGITLDAFILFPTNPPLHHSPAIVRSSNVILTKRTCFMSKLEKNKSQSEHCMSVFGEQRSSFFYYIYSYSSIRWVPSFFSCCLCEQKCNKETIEKNTKR